MKLIKYQHKLEVSAHNYDGNGSSFVVVLSLKRKAIEVAKKFI